jgi:sugar phosphate isomerase/epimerase
MNVKPLGIQMYSLRDLAQKDHIAAIKTVADIGYKGIETAGFYGMKPEQYRKVIEDHGLQICAAHLFPSPETVNQAIEDAQALGVRIVVGGLNSDDFLSRDTIKAAADRVRTMQEACAAKGLILALHNHWWEYEKFEDKLGVDYFVELCPKAWFEMDVYWASNFGEEDAAKQVRKFKSRAMLLHIKDGKFERDPAYHVAVGSGKIDIPAVINAADHNVLKWCIVELDECATDMVEAVRQSYQYLTSNGLAAGNR